MKIVIYQSTRPVPFQDAFKRLGSYAKIFFSNTKDFDQDPQVRILLPKDNILPTGDTLYFVPVEKKEAFRKLLGDTFQWQTDENLDKPTRDAIGLIDDSDSLAQFYDEMEVPEVLIGTSSSSVQVNLFTQSLLSPREEKVELRQDTSINKIDFAIIVALPEELDAVLSKLGHYNFVGRKSDSLSFYLAKIGQTQVLVTRSGAGNIKATYAATVLLERYQPEYLLMVGIAAGFRGKVELGDVVVAESCYYDGPGKETLEGKLPAPRQIPTGSFLLDRTKDYKALDWKDKIYVQSPTDRFQPSVHHGVIVSSEAVVSNSKYMANLLRVHRECRALAMEGFGVAEAAWNKKVDFLEIRGICDLGDADKDDKWHKYAADVAAAYAVGLLRYIESFSLHLHQSSNAKTVALSRQEATLLAKLTDKPQSIEQKVEALQQEEVCILKRLYLLGVEVPNLIVVPFIIMLIMLMMMSIPDHAKTLWEQSKYEEAAKSERGQEGKSAILVAYREMEAAKNFSLASPAGKSGGEPPSGSESGTSGKGEAGFCYDNRSHGKKLLNDIVQECYDTKGTDKKTLDGLWKEFTKMNGLGKDFKVDSLSVVKLPNRTFLKLGCQKRCEGD